MAYELQVNAAVTGAQSVEQLGGSTDRLAERTKKLNDALYGQGIASEKLTLASAKLATEEAKLEALREKHRMTTEGMAASTLKAAAAQDALAAGTQKTVSATMAAGAALRTLDGNFSSMRGAASFLSSIQGIGPALQASFQVFGAIALIGVLDKIPDAIHNGILALEGWTSASKSSFEKSAAFADQWALHMIDVNSRIAAIGMIGLSGSARGALQMQLNSKDAGALSGLLVSTQDRVTAAKSTIRDAEVMTQTSSPYGPVYVRAHPEISARQVEEAKSTLAQGEQQKQEILNRLEELDLTRRETAAGNIAAGKTEAEKRASEQQREFNRQTEWENKNAREYFAWKRKHDANVAQGGGGAAEFEWKQDHGSDEERRAAIIDDLTGTIPMSPTAMPAIYRSGQQQLRDARDNERRGMGILGLQGRLSGASQGAMANNDYAARIKYANEEYAAELRLAKTKEQEATALDQLDQKIFDAKMEREKTLYEIAIKQKEEFQSFATGFVDAARSGGISKFLTGQVNKLEDRVVSNAAGMIWPTIQKATSGLHATDGTFLGKMLAGTPFGPDPMKTAGATLTQAGVDLIGAAHALAASATGGGGGAVRFSGGGATYTGDGGSYDNAGGGANPAWSDTPWQNSGGGATYNGSGSGLSISRAMKYGTAAVGAGISIAAAATSRSTQGKLAGGGGALMSIGSVIPGPAGAAVMAAGAAISVISSMMGDPVAAYRQRVADTLRTNQFMSPVSINASMSMGGTYSDMDRYGNTRNSAYSPYPSVEQGFFDYAHGVTVPGRTNSQFGGLAITVHAMDAKSFIDHSGDISDAVNHALLTGRGAPLAETISSRR